MSAVGLKRLTRWIEKLAAVMSNETEPEFNQIAPFVSKPELAFYILEILADLDEEDIDQPSAYYSACVYALDVCITQIQYTKEGGNKAAEKLLNNVMLAIASFMQQQLHLLSFWLPVLNIFYLAKIEISEDLKDAYFALATEEEEHTPFYDEEDIRDTIREQIQDASALSVFEIAEIFFAQGHAMPADFFADLIWDLYHLDEGQEIALFILLHTKKEVRDVVVTTFEALIKKITLSAASLMRLKAIKHWYPAIYHTKFDYWIRIQEMKGVTAQKPLPFSQVKIEASEIDGRGTQGIFIRIKKHKQYYFCGLLLQYGYGIKDIWVTPAISSTEMMSYNEKIAAVNSTVRLVTTEYLQVLLEHFLALMINKGLIPDLHLLQIQELLGMHLKPKPIVVPEMIQHLEQNVLPSITKKNLEASLKRSSAWIHKPFTESWYIEDADIDAIVNRHATIIGGVKVCATEDAIATVFEEAFEKNREKWLFHFIWFALWANAKPSKRDKFDIDSAFIAQIIYAGRLLKDIPLMQKICYETVINSIETTSERRTHLASLSNSHKNIL